MLYHHDGVCSHESDSCLHSSFPTNVEMGWYLPTGTSFFLVGKNLRMMNVKATTKRPEKKQECQGHDCENLYTHRLLMKLHSSV